jgi:hypothetical protein
LGRRRENKESRETIFALSGWLANVCAQLGDIFSLSSGGRELGNKEMLLATWNLVWRSRGWFLFLVVARWRWGCVRVGAKRRHDDAAPTAVTPLTRSSLQFALNEPDDDDDDAMQPKR